MLASPGLRYWNLLKIGLDELSWLQAENSEEARAERRAQMWTPGLLVNRRRGGDLDSQWELTDSNNDGVLELAVAANGDGGLHTMPEVAVAVNKSGYLFYADAAVSTALTMPNDNTWYTIVLRRTTTENEPGTVQLVAGSAAVVGTGTKFTRLAGYTTDGFNRGSKMRVTTSGVGNNGIYEIDTVTDDTHCTLRSNAVANESGLTFSISGDSAGAAPANPNIHIREVYTLARIARVTQPADLDDIVLCDVKRNDADPTKCKIIDRRQMNLYRSVVPRHSTAEGLRLIPVLEPSLTAAAYTTVTRRQEAAAAPATAVEKTSVAEKSRNQLLMVASRNAAGVDGYSRSVSGAWSALGAIDATGAQPSLVRVPLQNTNDYTHVVVYTKANKLYIRTSTDEGATWSAETLIWDPTTVDAADTLEQPDLFLAANRRLFCAVSYFDNSVGNKDIRLIYSDDFGATWSVNGHNGYTVKTRTGKNLRHPNLGQNEDGILWCGYSIDTDQIGIFSTSDKSGVTWAASAGLDFLLLDTAVGGDSQIQPVLWFAPNGTLAVIFTVWTAAGGLIDLWVAYWSDPQRSSTYAEGVVWYERLWRIGAGVGAIQHGGVDICSSRSGYLHLSHLNLEPAPNTGVLSQLTPCFLPQPTWIVRD